MSQVKQWPRKVECTLCAEPHMVDARGLKQHQNKVRSEQGSASEMPLSGVSVETFHYSRGYVDGYRAALDDAKATKAA